MPEDKNTAFRSTRPASDETQPIIRAPKNIPPPEAAGWPEMPAQDTTRPMTPPPVPPESGTPPGAFHLTPQRLTPAPLVMQRPSGVLWALASGALIVALVSLLLNLALVSALLNYQKSFRGMLDQSIAALDDASSASLRFEFPVSQTINFEGDVPFKQDFNFPFKGNVRINTTIYMPVDLGPLGTRTVAVPVDTTVPVSTSVPVHIDQTFHVKTQVPVRMNVPIELSPRQPPLRDWLGKIKEWLILLRNQI